MGGRRCTRWTAPGSPEAGWFESGGEFGGLLNNNDFLHRVDNIAMELHPFEGDPRRLVAALRSSGFDLRLTDQFGETVPVDRAHYVNASSTGQLHRVP